MQDIIEDAQRRFDDILDPEIGNPMDYIKEGCTNIINISELSEKQANVAMGFYLQQLLKDRKNATIAKHGKSKKQKDYKFFEPVFIILE